MVHLKCQNAPFLINVHCMNHHTILVVYTFSKLSIVGKIKDELSLYAYFFHSPKKI
jgi:hypothetical protein